MRLHDYLDFFARETPDGEALIAGGEVRTYRDTAKSVNQLANALRASGLEEGDRAAFLAKNCLEYGLIYFACSKVGVVPVPLNFRLTPEEWRYIIEDAGAKVVLARKELVAGLDSVRAALPRVERFIAIGVKPPAGWEAYDAWVETHWTEAPSAHATDATPAYQMYTSGTTGRPKGAIITHASVSANIAQVQAQLFMKRGERYLVVVPLYHAAGALALFNTIAGGGAAYMQEDFNPHDVIRALSEDGVSLTTMVPAMIQACLLMVPGVAERKYPKLRQIMYGASPIGDETLTKAMSVFGCDFVQGYGLTEATAVVTFLLADDHVRALRGKRDILRSCGRPILGTEIRIAEAAGQTLPVGEVGEILARGPQIMQGYWNLPDATRDAFVDGWLRTGDIGRMDEEGYVYILDRAKDMIITGGENVYPNEVENALFGHPAIADVAVIGVPDAQWGESVKAVVVLREGQRETPDDIRAFCRGKLAGYKIPKSVDFVAALPRNATGKVLKRELRAPYWANHHRQVS
jgi:acyl-CoA synthetase (AMP-forming)/AMP-acid ligase II